MIAAPLNPDPLNASKCANERIMNRTSPITSTLLFLLLAAFALPLAAQDTPHTRGLRDGGARLERLADDLELTSGQREELKTIRDEQRAASRALGAEGSGSDDTARERRDLMRQSRQRMMAVLTPDQRERLRTLRDERTDKRADMRSELKAHRQNTILPELRTLRAEFDAELNAEERATIDTLRARVRQELPQGGLAKLNRVARREFLSANREQVQAVRAVARAHQTELDEVRTRLAAKRALWLEQINAIRSKHGAEPRAGDGLGDDNAAAGPRQVGALAFLLMDDDAAIAP